MEEIIAKSVQVSLSAATPAVVVICWLLGWAIKEYNWFNKKHIPITMMCTGVILVFFMNGGQFTVETVLLPGMISGAISVIGYDIVEQYVFKPRQEVKFNEIKNIEGGK